MAEPGRSRPDRVLRPAALAFAAALLGTAACGDGPTDPLRITSVEILNGDAVLELMDSLRLELQVRTASGLMNNRPIVWSCEPALSRQCGWLIEPRDTGTMRVVARVDDRADTMWVRIYEEGMLDLAITEPFPFTPTPMLEGSALVIRLEVTDSAGEKRTDRRIVWTVSDTTVATVRDTVWWNGSAWLPGGALRTRGSGAIRVTASVGGHTRSLDVVVRPRATSCGGRTALSLDLPIGELHRFRGNDPNLPGCLEFRAARDAGRQYLVYAERLPVISGSGAVGRRGLFFVPDAPPPPDSLIVQLYTAAHAAATAPRVTAATESSVPGVREWTIGGTTVRELPPEALPGAAAVRRPGAAPGVPGDAAAATTLAAGDTLVIPRLRTLAMDALWDGPGERSDRAVIRYVGDNLVFAEHVELFDTRLRRFNGAPAGPVPDAEYARIDAAFRLAGRQLTRLFGPSPTAAALGLPPGREIVVNAIFPWGVWGTTEGDIALFDYWSGTNGVTPGSLQDPLLLANQLIAHELAHVRHFQLQPPAPHLVWAVEGVARFVEHLAFAANLLGSDEPSRTGNVAAGAVGYPTMPNVRSNAELPSPAALESSFFSGYGSSAYVFDYLADHVSARGGDGIAAVREVLLALHQPGAANAALAAVLEPIPFDELVTRARIALVLDDGPTSAILPAWTQYLQYDIPASRPRNLQWPTAVPGQPFAASRVVSDGGAWGVYIDGQSAAGDQDFILDISRGPQAVLAIVRLR